VAVHYFSCCSNNYFTFRFLNEQKLKAQVVQSGLGIGKPELSLWEVGIGKPGNEFKVQCLKFKVAVHYLIFVAIIILLFDF